MTTTLKTPCSKNVGRQVKIGGSTPPKGLPVAGRKYQEPRDGDEGLIGQHLKALADKADLDADALGKLIGRDRDTVTLYFGGHRLPRPRDYRALAKALGLSDVRDLFPPMPTGVKKKR